jgi:hypothetical protein
MSAVRDCLFNIFAATLHIWRTRHAVVTVDPLNMAMKWIAKYFLAALNPTLKPKTVKFLQHISDLNKDHAEKNLKKLWVVLLSSSYQISLFTKINKN